MPAYEKYSFEQLRLADYSTGRRFSEGALEINLTSHQDLPFPCLIENQDFDSLTPNHPQH
jgi:hypothetical protein